MTSNSILCFAFLLAFVCLVAGQANKDPKCVEMARKSESGIRKLLLVDENSKLPKTDAEFREYCNLSKEMYKSLMQYKGCLTPLGQEALGMASKSIAKLLKEHCGTQAGREKSVKILNCAPDDTIIKTRECATQTLNVLEHLSSPAVKTSEMIPQICCMAHMSKECVQSKIRSTCSNIDVAGYFDTLVSSVSKEVLELACDDYKTWKQCEARKPAAMRQLKEVAGRAARPVSERKFVTPLLAIGAKIAE